MKFPFEFPFVGFLSFFFMVFIGCLVAKKAQEMSVNQKEIGWSFLFYFVLYLIAFIAN